MHRVLTMLVSSSGKLVWINSPGIYKLPAWQTVNPAEKARYELSHLDLHYLCGYPYQHICVGIRTSMEGLKSIPTCDLSI